MVQARDGAPMRGEMTQHPPGFLPEPARNTLLTLWHLLLSSQITPPPVIHERLVNGQGVWHRVHHARQTDHSP